MPNGRTATLGQFQSLSIVLMDFLGSATIRRVRVSDALGFRPGRRLRLVLPALAVALVAVAVSAPSGAASGPKNVNVLKLLGSRVASVKSHDGGVAVLLPATMALPRPDFTASSAKPGRYRLEIDGAEPCGGANVCLFALFTGVRGGRAYGKPIALHGGITGRYATIQCGASCSPASIDWTLHGVLYTIQANPSVGDHPGSAAGAVRAAFVAAANQSIDAGPR